MIFHTHQSSARCWSAAARAKSAVTTMAAPGLQNAGSNTPRFFSFFYRKLVTTQKI